MEKLKGYQKKYLKGLVHGMKPLVFVGQKGLSPTLTKAVDESLEKHELIKVKFVAFSDVDDVRAASTYSAHPNVKKYKDFRKNNIKSETCRRRQF